MANSIIIQNLIEETITLQNSFTVQLSQPLRSRRISNEVASFSGFIGRTSAPSQGMIIGTITNPNLVPLNATRLIFYSDTPVIIEVQSSGNIIHWGGGFSFIHAFGIYTLF